MLQRFWNNLGITHKFGLTFILILGFIVFLCALSYELLTTNFRQTVTDIERSFKIQNLVLEMDANIEKARRIKHEFSLTYLKQTDASSRQTDDSTAQVHELLVKASEQSEILKDLMSRSNVSDALRKSHINLNLYYSIANRCKTVFGEFRELALKLVSGKEGLQNQLREKAAILRSELEKIGDEKSLTRFVQTQLLVSDYLLIRQRPIMQSALNSAFFLNKGIQESPLISSGQKSGLSDLIDAYVSVAKEIPKLDVVIRAKSRDFDLNTETLEPISANLIYLANEEIRRSQTENARRVRLIGVLLLMAATCGFLLVGFLAYVVHKTITRNIVRLTNLASEIQAGNLDARDRLKQNDELGHLSESFDQMASRLKQLINGLEEQVEARTKDLSISNLSLKKEMAERRETEKAKAKLEAELRQIHKMEAIGTLAGGIAHDFNNILGIIIGNAELALDDVPDRNPARVNLEEVIRSSLRAKDVVRQLLSFSRKSELTQKPVNLGSIIRESLRLMRSSLPTTIEIRGDIPEDACSVLADPTQIHQIMINLCTNSAHAMEADGGVLEVSLRNRTLDRDGAAEFTDIPPGAYVMVTIRDTGHGIPPDIRERIFDPYFTTKDVGKGTGMGLAVVHGIIKNHKGAISAHSEPGKGTRFEILLPAISQPAEKEPETVPTPPKGAESILFVDDEQAIADMGKQMLERLGYKVTVRTNPVDALAHFRSHAEMFDLIITDMTMPKMTGAELVREVRKIHPQIPVILCSGYSDYMNFENAETAGIAKYIEKPLNKWEMAVSIREVLDRTPGDGVVE